MDDASSPIPHVIPQKRSLDDDYTPAVSSPLNPDSFTPPPQPQSQSQSQPQPLPAVQNALGSSSTPTLGASSSMVSVATARAAATGLRERTSAGRTKKPDSASTPASPTLHEASTRKTTSQKGRGISGTATPTPTSTPTPGPSLGLLTNQYQSKYPSPVRYRLPPPRFSDFDAPRDLVFVPRHTLEVTPIVVPVATSNEQQQHQQKVSEVIFGHIPDHVHNKKGFQYTHCIADPLFPSLRHYRQTEPGPINANANGNLPTTPSSGCLAGAHISLEDMATNIYTDASATMVTTDKGFRMARANVAAREGRWFWECRILRGIQPSATNASTTTSGSSRKREESRGHVRIGFSRREASLDAPVGFDAYSYGLRDKEGHRVHISRPWPFLEESIEEGDVIGLEIQLPSLHVQQRVLRGDPLIPDNSTDQDTLPPARTTPSAVDGKEWWWSKDWKTMAAPNILRDRFPIRFKSQLYFEQIDYQPIKDLEELINSAPAPTSRSQVKPKDADGLDTTASSAKKKPLDPADPASFSPTHPNPALRTLPHSHIKVYKNGRFVGTAFEDLLAFLPPASRHQILTAPSSLPTPSLQNPGQNAAEDDDVQNPANHSNDGQVDDGMLGYYPSVSVFQHGAAQVNLGPDFWFPPSDYAHPAEARIGASSGDSRPENELALLRPFSERYREQIIEDIVYDIVDEVDFWFQDGGALQDLERENSVPIKSQEVDSLSVTFSEEKMAMSTPIPSLSPLTLAGQDTEANSLAPIKVEEVPADMPL